MAFTPAAIISEAKVWRPSWNVIGFSFDCFQATFARRCTPEALNGRSGSRPKAKPSPQVALKQWIEGASESAHWEIVFSWPFELDYDLATDEQLAVEKARTTLGALQEEREGILAGNAAIQRDLEAGKYDDER